MLPNVFLVGAMKAATTAIAQTLSEHPDVFVAPIKEPNHFCADINRAVRHDPMAQGLDRVDLAGLRARGWAGAPELALIEGAGDYALLFEHAGDRPVVMEASTSYLMSTEAPELIKAARPGARVVISLRNPVDRARSEHTMHKMIGRPCAPFLQDLATEHADPNPIAHGAKCYTRAGRYADQVERYLSTFGSDAVFVGLYEDLLADEAGFYRRLAAFLGVEAAPLLDAAGRAKVGLAPRFAALNRLAYASGLKAGIARRLPQGLKERAKRLLYARHGDPPLTAAERASVARYFADDVARLSRLIDLSPWSSDFDVS